MKLVASEARLEENGIQITMYLSEMHWEWQQMHR